MFDLQQQNYFALIFVSVVDIEDDNNYGGEQHQRTKGVLYPFPCQCGLLWWLEDFGAVIASYGVPVAVGSCCVRKKGDLKLRKN